MTDKTVFQRLTNVVIGTGNGTSSIPHHSMATFNLPVLPGKGTDVVATFDNKQDRDAELARIKQEKLLAYQWGKIGYDTSVQQLAGANQVRVMYRDADLMDSFPEIGAALDIISEEATTINDKGKMLNIYSKSDRVKAILEDLFVNRLDIHVLLPMIFRATAKYGNEFMALNIDSENGILGWRELPVHEIQRVENGILNGYGGATIYSANVGNLQPDEVKFVWEGHNNGIPFKNWQVAHFRLIKDSLLLPYGVSYLNKARRHWRMLSMMEDAMLLYRLERSVERRIFKVNVGLIDDADIPAFLQEFMNKVKRAPIIDPQTGQMDLRKNFLDVSADYVIPVKNGQDPTSIEPLNALQNPTSMDDIKFIQNKIFAALRIPKSFLNFEEAQGKGQNLSLLDIRFNRAINSIQQSVIMELNKVAIIHLYLLGFEDDLTNFSISLNNPSNQIEMMMLDNLQKRLGAASTALAETGDGLPLMSWHRVQKDIMGLTDNEISIMLNEIRLEAALASELQMTNQIIKKTGMFNQVDRIYGEPGAKYSQNPQGDQNGGLGGLGGGGGAGGPMLTDMGGDLGGGFGDSLGDLGEPGADDTGDIGGEEGGEDLEGMPTENIHKPNGRKLLKEAGKDLYFRKYLDMLKEDEIIPERVKLIDNTFLINEELNSTMKALENNITKNIKKK